MTAPLLQLAGIAGPKAQSVGALPFDVQSIQPDALEA